MLIYKQFQKIYENSNRKFNIKILKMSDLYENRMKTKGKIAG